MNRYDKSDEIIKKGKRYLFEVTRFAEPVIVRGEGSIVWDADGNKYYDLNCNIISKICTNKCTQTTKRKPNSN